MRGAEINAAQRVTKIKRNLWIALERSEIKLFEHARKMDALQTRLTQSA
jgi:hypothetical protein